MSNRNYDENVPESEIEQERLKKALGTEQKKMAKESDRLGSLKKDIQTAETSITTNYWLDDPYPHALSSSAISMAPMLASIQIGDVNNDKASAIRTYALTGNKQTGTQMEEGKTWKPFGEWKYGLEINPGNFLRVWGRSLIAVGQLAITEPLKELWNRKNMNPAHKAWQMFVTGLAGFTKAISIIPSFLINMVAAPCRSFHRFSVLLSKQKFGRFGDAMEGTVKSFGSGGGAKFLGGIAQVVNILVFSPLKFIMDTASMSLNYAGSVLSNFGEMFKFDSKREFKNKGVRLLDNLLRILLPLAAIVALVATGGGVLTAIPLAIAGKLAAATMASKAAAAGIIIGSTWAVGLAATANQFILGKVVVPQIKKRIEKYSAEEREAVNQNIRKLTSQLKELDKPKGKKSTTGEGIELKQFAAGGGQGNSDEDSNRREEKYAKPNSPAKTLGKLGVISEVTESGYSRSSVAPPLPGDEPPTSAEPGNYDADGLNNNPSVRLSIS